MQPYFQTRGQLGQYRKRLHNYSYFLDDKIGRGYSSTVYIGYNDVTKEKVAIKVIELKFIKSQHHQKMLENEIQCIRNVKHKYLLRFIDYYETGNNIYIITEFCEGGDLHGLLRKRGRLMQTEIINIYGQFYQGYLHLLSSGFIHRDIKPSNILLKKGKIRIADFGIVKKTNEPQKQYVSVGTLVYMAPQSIISFIYNEKSDVWSIGVMLYQLAFGKLPWKGSDNSFLKNQILKSTIAYQIGIVSKDLISFISGCLDRNPNSRMGIKQMRQHPWMKNNIQLIKRQPQPNQLKQYKKQMIAQNGRQIKNLMNQKQLGSEQQISYFKTTKPNQQYNSIGNIDFQNKQSSNMHHIVANNPHSTFNPSDPNNTKSDTNSMPYFNYSENSSLNKLNSSSNEKGGNGMGWLTKQHSNQRIRSVSNKKLFEYGKNYQMLSNNISAKVDSINTNIPSNAQLRMENQHYNVPISPSFHNLRLRITSPQERGNGNTNITQMVQTQAWQYPQFTKLQPYIPKLTANPHQSSHHFNDDLPVYQHMHSLLCYLRLLHLINKSIKKQECLPSPMPQILRCVIMQSCISHMEAHLKICASADNYYGLDADHWQQFVENRQFQHSPWVKYTQQVQQYVHKYKSKYEKQVKHIKKCGNAQIQYIIIASIKIINSTQAHSDSANNPKNQSNFTRSIQQPQNSKLQQLLNISNMLLSLYNIEQLIKSKGWQFFMARFHIQGITSEIIQKQNSLKTMKKLVEQWELIMTKMDAIGISHMEEVNKLKGKNGQKQLNKKFEKGAIFNQWNPEQLTATL